ncbi:MAG: endonuclease/exonuclease/phosphatase family protein [Oscillospiraceae bacterium]|nr:endonuclease/exonuclease/phosphatase family protein [Oscillospiraceae bacterium]
MKLLTLNTHSLQEENYPEKLRQFVDGILKEKPDIIAMQEVNQTADAELMDVEMLEGQYPIPGCMKIRKDNHAAVVASLLWRAGIACYWVWLPIKLGYDKYDEGVAILSLGRKIRCVDKFPISKVNDYHNWRTRAVLGVQVEGLDDWFYSLHMGWWDDASERFLNQWKVLNSCIAGKRMCGNVWLLGDFNAPDGIPGQSYEHIAACGWFDTFQSAHSKDSGITVPGVIDGWREKLDGKKVDGMRLDYIWCSKQKDILSSRVVFNGTKEPVVSDHFGVLIEVKE